MNGLLHRVAALAAGTAVVVRSDARLPYAAAGFGSADAGAAQDDVAGTMAPGAPMAPAPAVHARERTGEPAPLVAAPTDAAGAGDAPATAHTATTVAGVVSVQPAAFDQRPATMPPSQEALLMPIRARAVIGPEAGAARAAGESATSADITTRTDEPAPLMPRGARPAPLTAVAPPSTRSGPPPQGAAPAQGDADTEVHIHIGRIDVTAVHEAPAARRRAPAAPAPMSLDGYLAQRGRT